MMNIRDSFTYDLSASAIDEMAEKIDAYLVALKTESKNRHRIRLSMEEILLRMREAFGEEATCVLRMGTHFGRPRLMLEVQGVPFDPTVQGGEDGEFSGWSNRMLGSMGLYPLYSYTDGKNQVLLKLKKPRRSPLVSLLFALAAAVLVGLAGMILPQNLVSVLLENLITPLYDAFLGVLGTIAGPMVFLAVAWGVYGIGDISTFGRIGKRMLLRFVGISFAMTAVTAAVCLPAFSIQIESGSGTANNQLWGIFQMLLDILPDNIVTPFQEGNSMQIILMAVFVGGALLVLGKQVAGVSALVEQLNGVIGFVVELISSLVPFFIFIVVVQMFWTNSFGVISQAWWAVVVFLLVMAVILTFVFLYVSRRNQISPFLLASKCAETFVVALTTASSTATFGTAMQCCERKLGLGSYLTNFGLPLGMVFCPPATSIYFVIICFYVAKSYAVPISAAWILMAVLVTVILAIASPPIPGGTLACYTVMFAQLGIPTEGLVVAMAVDVLFDFVATAANMVLLEAELIQQGRNLHMLDRAVLSAKTQKSR